MAEPDALDKYIRGLKDFTGRVAEHFHPSRTRIYAESWT
jgi:hypothetical protein